MKLAFDILKENMEALYVILGWLFGLLSSPIALRIERHYKRKDIQTAIFSELKNLAVRLATTCRGIQHRLGCVNKADLEWLKNVYQKYRENCPQDILTILDMVSKVPSGHLDELSKMLEAKKPEAIGLKPFSLRFIESVLEYLSIFDSRFQRDIMEIYTQLDILNEDINDAIFHYRLTFDPSSMGLNKDIIRKNLNNGYGNIQRRCKNIVGKIDEVLRVEKKQ